MNRKKNTITCLENEMIASIKQENELKKRLEGKKMLETEIADEQKDMFDPEWEGYFFKDIEKHDLGSNFYYFNKDKKYTLITRKEAFDIFTTKPIIFAASNKSIINDTYSALKIAGELVFNKDLKKIFAYAGDRWIELTK